MKPFVFLIEDDPDIVELVRYNLEKNGYSVDWAQNGYEAFSRISKRLPHLILLDLMLPQLGGFEICKKLKSQEETRHIPLIMLTAKGEEVDRVLGLEIGADDYVVKPFSPRELTARIHALLRRSKTVREEEYPKRVEAGPVLIRVERHEATLHGKRLDLTLAEFRILELLASSPGRVYTRDQLLNTMTGGDIVIVDRNIDVHVHGIRKKLGSDGRLIQTVRSVGYKFADL